VFRRIDRAYRNFIDGFGAWIAQTQRFVADRYGADGLAMIGSSDDAYRSALLHGLTDEDVTGRHRADRADRIADLIESGDHEAALAAFDSLTASYRRIHDVERDRVASVLSQVYRAWGPDVLEESIRFAGEQTLLGWMPHDVARPAEVRVRQWAAMQKGNFADITVRRKNQGAMWDILNDFASRYTKRELMAILNELNVPCGPVMSTADLADDDHVRGREMYVELDHPERGPYWNLGCPIKLSDSPAVITRSPLLGEHTDEILGDVLGYGGDEIAQMKEAGAFTFKR